MDLLSKIKHFVLVLIFALVALLAFISSAKALMILAKFISSLDILVPAYSQEHHVGEQHPKEEWIAKLVVDVLLLAAFVIQHSLMAKDWWKSLIYALHLGVIERALYIISTSFMLMVVIANWQCTFTIVLWAVDTEKVPALWLMFTLIHVIGWTLILGATLLMDAYELIGLKQVYYYYMGLVPPLLLKSSGLRRMYGDMRHPGTCAFTLMLLLHPQMTASRALLTFIMALYTITRFNVDKEDHSYMQQKMVSKEDDLSAMVTEAFQQDAMSVRRVWRESFIVHEVPTTPE